MAHHPSGLTVDRRHFLAGGAAFGGAIALGDHSPAFPVVGAHTIARASSVRAAGSDLGAVKHVIFLMQENRSFDHYFGAYPGVHGFNDHSPDSLGPFAQPFSANQTRTPYGVQLPFHLDTRAGHGECTHDIGHDWATQHLSWNGGSMDAFVEAHTSTRVDGPMNGLLTMGYYNRVDLPYHYALADAFTICDRYHSSIMGPTHPNRLMTLSGTIDPDGTHGGPVLTTQPAAQALFSVNWTTVPELLEDARVSWKTYTTPGQGFYPPQPEAGFGNAILPYFAQYKNRRSALYRKAFLPTFPNDFAHDVRSGRLPSVSWIISPNGQDEHPPAPPGDGAWFINRVLQTLIANREVWAETVLFLTYDENGGYFDHVAPPVAPPGAPGEFVSVSPLPPAAKSISGPLGLGFRVPMLVVSPFSRGGWVTSEVLDHTSQIRFLEERFAIRSPNISPWRRQSVGDLTGSLRMNRAILAPPRLPPTMGYRTRALSVQGCTARDVNETRTDQPPYPLATTQTMPTQAPGSVKRLP